MRSRFFALLAALAFCLPGQAQTRSINDGWKFSLGNAASPEKDFGSGTEYFNYLTKARSIHNQGPYTPSFDDGAWEDIRLPHDWVTTLPYDAQASHSHGYKTVGWKYPQTSVGWYRRHLDIPAEKEGRHFQLRFDGIFRAANVWFNGIWMGTEPSGYAVQTYDITPYIHYGGDNVICVRADATLEEGWFYEGAGIYRNAYLEESSLLHPLPGGIWTEWGGSLLQVHLELENTGTVARHAPIEFRLLDAEGKAVWEKKVSIFLRPQATSRDYPLQVEIPQPHLWSPEDPYLYTLQTAIGEDLYETQVGLRTAKFTAGEGFLLNGKKYTLKGVNLHQDHAGVGSALPDGLIEWRVKELQKYGVNAIRCSHNPASPALLDICDRLGVLIIDENRLMGVNAHHQRELENMVRWGRSHPSVILWSVGNEEWGLENDPRGIAIVQQMQAYVRLLDPSRQTTAANAGGAIMIEGLQVHGYNYIIQNNVEERHKAHPEWIIYGSEETTGCGTRGVYAPEPGHMPAINRGTEPGVENVIERGWQFYRDHPWTGGVFFWTGLDYRGEPNPLQFPSHDSEFGLLDYCGFPKDEAFYLKAAWTEEPVLHVFPHWNWEGREGQPIEVWAYSNCDEVQLSLNGKKLERQAMPRDGHLKWEVPFSKGKLVATGYRNGKKVVTETLETTGKAAQAKISAETIGTTTIVLVELQDGKGRFVPDACPSLTLCIDGPGRIIGAGNGDPACMLIDHPTEKDCRQFTFPAFNGRAQFLLEGEAGRIEVLDFE